MSKTIKIHTPAGRVRVLDRKTRKPNTVPFAIFSDETPQSAKNENRLPTEAKGIEDTPHASPLDMEQRLNEEYRAGFDEGRRFAEKSLRDELAADLANNREAIERVTASLVKEYDRLHEAAERNVVKLAMAIAGRIVKRELVTDDEVVLRQIHEATRRVIGVERIKIRVNPADEGFVRDHRTHILTTTDAVREVAVEADETIERGGCILESEAGNVDALIATQLERIGAAILSQQHKE